MADRDSTKVSERLIWDENVTRSKLNVTVSGKAVVRKIIAGSGISITETGVDDGTGDVTINNGGLALGDWIDPIVWEYRDIEAGVSQTYVLDPKALFAYTINSVGLEVDTGTLTGVAIKIGSTAVTSLSSLTVDTAIDTTDATGANSVAIGDRVTLVTSTGYTGMPQTLIGNLSITRL